jgi:hypothetical protein
MQPTSPYTLCSRHRRPTPNWTRFHPHVPTQPLLGLSRTLVHFLQLLTKIRGQAGAPADFPATSPPPRLPRPPLPPRPPLAGGAGTPSGAAAVPWSDAAAAGGFRLLSPSEAGGGGVDFLPPPLLPLAAPPPRPPREDTDLPRPQGIHPEPSLLYSGALGAHS